MRLTPEGKYCSHDFYELPDSIDPRERLGDADDQITEVSKAIFDSQQPFHRVERRKEYA